MRRWLDNAVEHGLNFRGYSWFERVSRLGLGSQTRRVNQCSESGQRKSDCREMNNNKEEKKNPSLEGGYISTIGCSSRVWGVQSQSPSLRALSTVCRMPILCLARLYVLSKCWEPRRRKECSAKEMWESTQKTHLGFIRKVWTSHVLSKETCGSPQCLRDAGASEGGTVPGHPLLALPLLRFCI